MKITELIERKKLGKHHTKDEIDFIIKSYVKDYDRREMGNIVTRVGYDIKQTAEIMEDIYFDMLDLKDR